MVLRIDPLTKSEIRILKKIYAYDRRSRWRKCARILLLANQGYSCPAIAVQLNCHPTTARRWLTRWQQNGLTALNQTDCMTDQVIWVK